MIPSQFNPNQFPLTGYNGVTPQSFNPAMFSPGYYPYVITDTTSTAFKKKAGHD
jgi:hypothetical protein